MSSNGTSAASVQYGRGAVAWLYWWNRVARRAKAGEATAAAVAAATAPGGGQQERKQYKRSTTSYGLRKLPKPPGCRKCKGNARGCRIKDHQLEDASDEQVRSSSVLLY